MTKQAIFAVVVGALILVAATGAFLYSQNRPDNSATIAEVKTTPTPNNAMANSITELLNSGETSKCTVNVAGENGNTSGTVYTSGENARADMTIQTSGENTTTYMIRNGDTFYMWGDSLPIGIKMVMSVNDLASRMQDNETFNTFDPNQEVDFKCTAWTEDVKLFTPPTTVRFTSFGGSVPTGTTTTTSQTPTSAANSSDNTKECNICNSLTGAAKSACLQQFSCQ